MLELELATQEAELEQDENQVHKHRVLANGTDCEGADIEGSCQ